MGAIPLAAARVAGAASHGPRRRAAPRTAHRDAPAWRRSRRDRSACLQPRLSICAAVATITIRRERSRAAEAPTRRSAACVLRSAISNPRRRARRFRDRPGRRRHRRPSAAACRARDSASAGRRVRMRTARRVNGAGASRWRRGGSGAAEAFSGRRTWKVDPTFGGSPAVIVPPMSSASSRHMAKPRPVPPKRRVVDSSA